MLETIQFLRTTRGGAAAIIRLCRAFNLTDDQTTRVLIEFGY